MDLMLWIPVGKHCSAIRNSIPYEFANGPGKRSNVLTHGNGVFCAPCRLDAEAIHCCPACYKNNRKSIYTSYRAASSTSKTLLYKRKLVISNSKLFLVNVLLKCVKHRMEYEHRKMVDTRNNLFEKDFFLTIPCTNSTMFYGFIYELIFTQIICIGDKILLRSSSKYMLRLKLDYVLAHKENRHHTWNVLLDVAVACYLVALSNMNLIDGIKETTSSITSTAVTNTATFGIEQAAQIVGNTAASTAVSAVVDVAISSAMLYMAKRQRDEGIISDKEFTTRIKKTVFKSTLKIAAGATGSIIGQAVIPVPVLGGLVGGFCGSLIGTGIAKGISYGLFDRNEKKQEAAKQEDEEYGKKSNLFHRKFRGHIPKITIYNDNTKQFEEKYFKQDVSKYLKHQFMKQDIGIHLPSNSSSNSGGGGHSLVDFKEIKSPLLRRRTVKVKEENKEGDGKTNNENDANLLENNEFLKKWKVKIQSMPTIPKKKQPLLLTNTDQVVTSTTETDIEHISELLSVLHVDELAEESFVDASAVIITDKDEQEMLSNSINAGKQNSEGEIVVNPSKSLTLSNITLQNLKEAFTVNKKLKQEKQKDSIDETANKEEDKGTVDEPCVKGVEKTEQLIENELNSSKRNFMGNFFQQIKQGTSLKILKSPDDMNNNDRDRLKTEEHEKHSDGEKEGDSLTQRADDTMTEQEKQFGFDEALLSDLNNVDLEKGASNQQWQHLFKIFKEQRELETEGYKNLIDKTIEVKDENSNNQFLKKALAKIKDTSTSSESNKEGEKNNSFVSFNVLSSEKTNVDTHEDNEKAEKSEKTEKTDTDSSEEERARKTSFFNYCHNVYDQLERKVSGNIQNNTDIPTTLEKPKSSSFSFSNPIKTVEKPNISLSLSNPLSRKEKKNEEIKQEQPLNVEVSEPASDTSKKKSVFDRVKSISKTRFSLKS